MTRRPWQWGKAGVRRTAGEAAARAKQLESARARGIAADQRGYRQWRAGRLQPFSITLWLDSRELDGPEVDAALGVEEPTVDEWEAGIRYPTWEQTQALAKLCNVTVEMLTRQRPEPPPSTSMRFHVADWPREPPIMRFRQDAIAKTLEEHRA